jgi:hypothetical protein
MHPTSTRLVAAEKARPLDSDGTAPTWRILVGTAGGRLRCSSGAGSGTTPREPWAEAWPGCSRLPLRSQSGLPVLSEACQSPLRVSEASPRGGQTLRRLHQRIGPLPGSFSARLRVPNEASFLPRQRMPRIGCRPSDCCSLASCWLVLWSWEAAFSPTRVIGPKGGYSATAANRMASQNFGILAVEIPFGWQQALS